MQIYWNERKCLQEKNSTPTGMYWYTNMAVISLFYNTEYGRRDVSIYGIDVKLTTKVWKNGNFKKVLLMNLGQSDTIIKLDDWKSTYLHHFSLL